MHRELKELRRALERSLEALDKGACRAVPKPLIKQATKVVNSMTDSVNGDDLLDLGEACAELGVGSTTLNKLIKRGDIKPPEPLNGDGQRVGIRRKYIEEYLRQRQL